MKLNYRLAFFACALLPMAACAFRGDGTTYDLGNLSGGNCNLMYNPAGASTNFAAINAAQWEDSMSCGRCAQVTCVDELCAESHTQSEVVYIVDQCPGCKFGDLDLSPGVFADITGSTPSRVAIEWTFVDCPVSGNIQYCLKAGSNSFWTAVQPNNLRSGVKNLTINGNSVDMVASSFYFLLDGDSQTKTDLTSVKISMVSVDGDEVSDTVSFSKEGSCVQGASQFKGTGSGGFTATASIYSSPSPTAVVLTPTPTTGTPASSESTAPTSAPEPTSMTPQPTNPPTTSTPVPSKTDENLKTSASSSASHGSSTSGRSANSNASSSNENSSESSSGSRSATNSNTGSSSSSRNSNETKSTTGNNNGSSSKSSSEKSNHISGSDATQQSKNQSSSSEAASKSQAQSTNSSSSAESITTRSEELNATGLVLGLTGTLVIGFIVVGALIILAHKRKACPEKTDDHVDPPSEFERGHSSSVFVMISTPTCSMHEEAPSSNQ